MKIIPKKLKQKLVELLLAKLEDSTSENFALPIQPEHSFLDFSHSYASRIEPFLHDAKNHTQGSLVQSRTHGIVLCHRDVVVLDFDQTEELNKVQIFANLEKEFDTGVFSGQSAVVYETKNGLRLLVTSIRLSPSEALNRGWLDVEGIDKLYSRLSLSAGNWRSRLTPKPERMISNSNKKAFSHIWYGSLGPALNVKMMNVEIRTYVTYHASFGATLGDDNFYLA